MPKNNGKARRAWRKQRADFNAAYWVQWEKDYTAEDRKNPGPIAFARGRMNDRPVKPNTNGN